MPATRIQQFQFLTDPFILQQVAGALLHAASGVLTEDVGTVGHEARVNLAHSIMSNAMQQAQMMMPWMLQNAVIANGAGGPVLSSGTAFTDADIDLVVSSFYNTLAGV